MGAVLCEEEVMAGSPQVGVSQPRGYGGGNPSDLLDAVRGVLPISSTAVLCCRGRWWLPKQSGGKSLLPREPTCILLCAQEPVSPHWASWYLPSSSCQETITYRSPSWSASPPWCELSCAEWLHKVVAACHPRWEVEAGG